MPIRATLVIEPVERSQSDEVDATEHCSPSMAGALSVGLAGPSAAQVQIGDGLVNVQIGDVTILEDVRIGVAAQIAAEICGVKVGPVVLLATEVDATGDQETICKTQQGPVRIVQN